ncbi:MAG: hypothetical protein Q9195_001717 [Heterodermia aff. obscurata]
MSSLSNDEASPHVPPPDPPPPPPLPPQRYGNRAANAIARFAQPFIYSSRPPSAEGNRNHESKPSRLKPATRSTTHKTGIPIAALDKSPDGRHAVVAGRDILKTIQIFESSCAEDINLRSRIVTYAATHSTSQGEVSAKHKDQLAANDVKWSPGEQSTIIATAAANGQVVIYDLNRPGLESARLHEHNRQVHKLAFNPYRGVYLLSGSQDATVRLWDLRALAGERSVMRFGSANRYSLNNEGIRDLRWSPKDVMDFAAGTDNGVIQRWDFRKNSSPLLKLNAHEKTCHAIDWHPDGKHLASGGADKNVKIWDFSSTDRRMKPCWQLRAPQAIREVRWRPSCSENQRSADVQCTQFATSYDHQDPRVHIWDLRRPFIPAREIDRYDTPPTAMLWCSDDLLWSVGSEGMFTQTDINHTSNLVDQRSPNVVAFGPDGTLNIFSEKRARSRISVGDAPGEFLQGQSAAGVSGESLSGSHSATNGSFEEPSLLSSSFKSRQRKTPVSKSSKSIASTPPWNNDGEPILKLDEALQDQYLYQCMQYAARGNVLGVFDADAFKFLARNYRFPPSKPAPHSEWSLHLIVASKFEKNATLAESVGQHRLAQSWRILGMALEKELQRRAEGKRKIRLQLSKHRDSANHVSLHSANGKTETKPAIPLTHHKSQQKIPQTTLIAPLAVENGSNMTTPLARPVSDLLSNVDKHRNLAVLEDEAFRLPTAAFTKQSPRKHLTVNSDLTKMKNSVATRESESIDKHVLNSDETNLKSQIQSQGPPAIGFRELDHHMNERRAAMDHYRAHPRPPLTLDEPFHTPRDFLAPALGRHDSNESFQMFSASTDSSHRTASIGGSFGSSQESERSGSTPERLRMPTRENGEASENYSSPDILLEVDQSNQGYQNSPTSANPSPGASSHSLVPETSECSPSTIMPSKPRRPRAEAPIINVGDFASSEGHDDISLDHTTDAGSKFIFSDYTSSDESMPLKPWTASAMLSPLINYHLKTLSDTQMPSFLLLYLAPYMSLGISSQLELSFLLSYHEQLISLSLYCEAAHLRNLVDDTHPEVTEHGTYGITPGGPWCTNCRKPSKGERDNFCERCNNAWNPCPICNGEGPIATLKAAKPDLTNCGKDDSLWGWCQGCGHGGHVGCLRVWWDDPVMSEGNCATMGCLHDCVSGVRRDETLRKAAEDRKAGFVKGDEWVVGESRAVEKARDLIGRRGSRGGRRGQAGAHGRSGGQGPLSAGLGGRSGSGSGSIGKKVRLVVPEGEGADQGAGQLEPEDQTSASAP